MKRCVLVLSLFLASAAWAAPGDSWNLTTGWSNANNPTPVWSYEGTGGGANPTGPMASVADYAPEYFGSGQPAWAKDPNTLGTNGQAFGKCVSNNPSGFDLLAGDVFTYGNAGAGTIVLWYCPETAWYTVDGKAWRPQYDQKIGDIWFFEGTGWDGIYQPYYGGGWGGGKYQLTPGDTGLDYFYTRSAPYVFPTITVPMIQGRGYAFFVGGLNGGSYNLGFVGLDVTITQIVSQGPICTTPEIPGDLNLDCRVNLQDFAVLAANWLVCHRDPASTCSQ
jgi:hypothetical protein